MSNRAGNKGTLIRLIAILIVGGAAILIATNMRSPLSLSESRVREMVRKHQLIGISLADAAKRLQHQAPDTSDGSVVFDFKEIKGWTGGKLRLEVVGGKVTRAQWMDASAPVETE